MTVEPGQGGHIQRLETSFKNANYEKDGLFVIYNNKFLEDVIGSRTVSTILKFKAADSVAYIEYNKGIHEEVGLVTQRNLAIVLKIRSRLMDFFFWYHRGQRSTTNHRYRSKGTAPWEFFGL